ncbi:protein APEM9 isoform X3 [Rhododendron vialii]|uniref:protein APEM9 isoform X3 n=1 Tax=Rhododendron vialii TaxID=182163 RepID=UPI00265E1A4B|nr:protein APEM9 isoform X3 [Rhododendron vialii]
MKSWLNCTEPCEMAISASNLAIWEEIERSESYLVSCMYEEAASTASSVLSDLCNNKSAEVGEEAPLNDMLESAGMVLVQSLKELGRVCFQISEGSCTGSREFLEEFLGKWRFVDGRYYVLATAESNVGCVEGAGGHFVLHVDEYLEVVEAYVVTLAMVLKDIGHAISWVEQAELPEEKRQELLRRLQSLYSPKPTGSSQGSIVALPEDESKPHSSSIKEQYTSGRSPEALKTPYPSKGNTDTKEVILKLSQQRVSCFWWFRTVTLKFGNGQLLISNGKIVLGCLMILMYYILRRKQATVKRILRRQALSMKKALVDLWQLAFSYQVNPLAAVQPVPTATRGSR